MNGTIRSFKIPRTRVSSGGGIQIGINAPHGNSFNLSEIGSFLNS